MNIMHVCVYVLFEFHVARFVGNMDRQEAVNCLQRLPDNVFLVRTGHSESQYALSLK